MPNVIVSSLVFLGGATLSLSVVLSALRTFVLPRSARDPIARLSFLALGKLFKLPLRLAKTYLQRDAILAHYAPMGLLNLIFVWLFFSPVGLCRNVLGLGWFDLWGSVSP